ncbi:MAG: thiol oxidoreductase, partial [Acidobacteria bacterium]
NVTAGEAVFDRIGCENCHTDSITTAPSGTVFNGGFFTVNGALGSKTIRPYGDFMLHDIGTGDGIPQGKATAAQIRTAPLWGLRTRTRLMHDGQSLTITQAIRRHAGQATPTVTAFNALSAADTANLMSFLNSL